MRIGGQIFYKYNNAEEWANAIKIAGYNAAYCPVSIEAGSVERAEYRKAAENENIIIAEVGSWSNPISKDINEQKQAICLCKESLSLADEIGALCCVNIAGSRGSKWDGPHHENFSSDTFTLIVDTVREIIDAVCPINACYTLETMPWIFPDSADSYLEIIKAIDRKQFAVHLDPVNLINSPRRYYNNAEIIKDCFSKLGPYIKSCHAKDIILEENLTVHLNEAGPGLGVLDYQTYIKEILKLNRDVPLMIEHLSNESEFALATEYIKSQVKKIE